MRNSPIGWGRSLFVAGVAAYAPHVVVTLYTLGFVDCGHCKTTSLQILPVSPGFLGSLFALSATGLRGSDLREWLVAGPATLAFIVAIAALGRLGRAWLAGGAVAAALLGGAGAVITLKLLQA